MLIQSFTDVWARTLSLKPIIAIIGLTNCGDHVSGKSIDCHLSCLAFISADLRLRLRSEAWRVRFVRAAGVQNSATSTLVGELAVRGGVTPASGDGDRFGRCTWRWRGGVQQMRLDGTSTSLPRTCCVNNGVDSEPRSVRNTDLGLLHSPPPPPSSSSSLSSDDDWRRSSLASLLARTCCDDDCCGLDWYLSVTDADNWRLYGVLDNRDGFSSADWGFSEHDDADWDRTGGFESTAVEEANFVVGKWQRDVADDQ